MTFSYALKSFFLKPFMSVASGSSWSQVQGDVDAIWVSSQRWHTDLIAIAKARNLKDTDQLYAYRSSRFVDSELAKALLARRELGSVKIIPVSVFWGRG